MRLLITETYLVNIPETNDYQEAIEIFHSDGLLDVPKHYGYQIDALYSLEDVLLAENKMYGIGEEE